MAKKQTTKTKLVQPAKPVTKDRVRRLGRKQKKKAVKQSGNVPGGLKLLFRALAHLWQHKKLFVGLFAVYFIANFVLVKGLAANFQLTDTKSLLEDTFGNELGTAEKGATLFGVLLGSASAGSGESAGVYQTIIYIVVSLAVIWALRQTFEGKVPSIKQSFYKSTHALIPYLAVYMVLILQLIPMLIGVSLFSIITSNNIAANLAELSVWFLLMMGLIWLSLYFAVSTFVASYIVTLHDMEPLKALRLAKATVRFRRMLLIRRLLFFAFAVTVFGVVVFVPLALFIPVVAEVLFMVLYLMLLIVFHAYAYSLYRELI